MTYNEIDKLAQDAASKLDKGADLGTVYAYHALREVYELYRCGKKPREQADRDRRLIAHAYRRWEQDMERHFALCRERNEQLLRAGTLRSELMKGLGHRPAEELLGIACACISAMAGEETLARRCRQIYGGTDSGEVVA